MTRSAYILIWLSFIGLPAVATETTETTETRAPSAAMSAVPSMQVLDDNDGIEPTVVAAPIVQTLAPVQDDAAPSVSPQATPPSTESEPAELAVKDAAQVAEVVESDALLSDNSEQDEIRYQQALDSMRAGDYAEAFCLWKPLAEGGHAKSQFSLGWMYHNGYGLAINNSKALVWWEKAAEQGIANAAFALGLLFSNGDQDIRKDIERASQYFQQAALLEHGDARSMLAYLFEEYPQEMQALSANWTEQQWSLVGKILSIRVRRANMRSGPGLDKPVLRVLEQGMRVARLVRKPHWVQISIPGDTLRGWVYASLLEEVLQAGDGEASSTPRVEPDAPHAEAGNPLP